MSEEIYVNIKVYYFIHNSRGENFMKFYITRLFMFFCLLFLISGCASKKVENEKTLKQNSKSEKVTITSGVRSTPVPGAKAVITFPEDGAILENDDVYVVVDVGNFSLGEQTDSSTAGEIANSINGQHVHLIVDNKPYKAVYQAGKPVNIGKLEPGPHSIFVFPSRSYHESVKEEGAFDMLNFYIESDLGDFELSDEKPAIFYSRPKGEYKGLAAQKIMLDFYLHNLRLSPNGFNVKYTITKVDNPSEKFEIVIDDWKPAFINNLSSGRYNVKMELIDPSGNLVNNVAYNGTEREIAVISE